MSTPKTPKPILKIKVQHIGPIMSLDAPLSSEKQNLIFARNGTGKSFLARSLRLLDDEATLGVDEHEIPKLLVSEESASRQGYFQLYEDSNCVGSLGLNAQHDSVNKSQPAYIFHVFSEDYVDYHLRQKGYTPDGEISHEIIVGQDNSEIDEKQTQLNSTNEQLTQKRTALNEKFLEQMESLRKDFQINRQLGAYKSLSSGVFFETAPYTAPEDSETVKKLLSDYTDFKSLPPDAVVSEFPKWEVLKLDLDAISETLGRVTSPSVVAETFKDKIQTDPTFFEIGAARYQENSTECPFCTQTLSSNALQAVSAYVDYFNDAEAKEKSSIESFIRKIDAEIVALDGWQNRCLAAKESFDDLKQYFPSMRDKKYSEVSSHCGQVSEYFEHLKRELQKKLSDLTQVLALPADVSSAAVSAIEAAATGNRSIASD